MYSALFVEYISTMHDSPGINVTEAAGTPFTLKDISPLLIPDDASSNTATKPDIRNILRTVIFLPPKKSAFWLIG
jgi:hypothetical protein